MKKIDLILLEEANRLLALNEQEVLFNIVKELIEDISSFVKEILNWNVNEKELEENFLTKTIVFLWKLEKIRNTVTSKKLGQIIIPIDFNLIDYNDFIEYYRFLEIQSDEWITGVMWNTTSVFNKLQKSDNYKWVYLLQQEVYEHENDVDDSRYYVILKWL